jgi:DNA replication protein DnaC
MTETKKFGISELIISINGEDIVPVPPELICSEITEPLEVEFKDFESFIAFFFNHVDLRDYGKREDIHCKYCGGLLSEDGRSKLFCCEKMKAGVLYDQNVRNLRKLRELNQEEENVYAFRMLLNESGLEGWEQSVTFKTYQPKNEIQESIKKECRRYCEDQTKDNLLLKGKVGTGKTHLACACAKWLGFYQEKTFLILRCSSVSMIDNMEKYKTADVVIVDDIGRETGSESRISARMGIISEIIEYRHRNKKKTIYTTNLSAEELSKKYGSHIVDRIIDCAVIPERMEFESNRGQI